MQLFALYVIAHGHHSPGGGFQGGVILASAYILYCLIFGVEQGKRFVPEKIVDALTAIGVLMFAGVGVWNLFVGGNFLDYTTLNPQHAGAGEALGMMLVEYGVGVTVCSVMMTIFNQVTEPPSDR